MVITTTPQPVPASALVDYLRRDIGLSEDALALGVRQAIQEQAPLPVTYGARLAEPGPTRSSARLARRKLKPELSNESVIPPARRRELAAAIKGCDSATSRSTRRTASSSQFSASCRVAACGQQVIDDQHALATARAPCWISSLSLPYSRAWSTAVIGPGSLPGLRTGTNPKPIVIAKLVPTMKPRASIPILGLQRANACCMPSIPASKPGDRITGVRSRNKFWLREIQHIPDQGP